MKNEIKTSQVLLVHEWGVLEMLNILKYGGQQIPLALYLLILFLTYAYVLSRPSQDHRLFHITIIINRTTFASRILLFLLKIIQDYESVFCIAMLRTLFYVKVVL